MDPLLEQLSASVSSAKTVEELARPLLEMLESVTGLESTYLTMVDLHRGVQRILFARNSGHLQIPEGLEVPWADTLCKRALESQQPFTNDVGQCWGDSDAARELGIMTYLSSPVYLTDGALYGTLCAASDARKEPDPSVMRILSLFATLLAHHVERESLLRRLVQANQALEASALTDPLTELPNRRAVLQALSRQLAQGARDGSPVLLALIDLDRFKPINDRYGHDVGDQFLVEVARRLRQVLRGEDMAARFGGDEFIVVAPGPDQAQAVPEATQTLKDRLDAAIIGMYALKDGIQIDYQGASIGVLPVEPGTLDAMAAIKEADALMYTVKRQRAERIPPPR